MTARYDITIDGSEGEGGGQMLRSSLALSMITGRSLRLINIRAGRKRPGLMRQHLTCVNAAAEISGADVQGAHTGSKEVTFVPGTVQSGDYRFRIGSAGSVMLVLQTILPPLLSADAPSQVTVEGGTHNMQAPPFDFLQRSWQPLMERFGPGISLQLLRHGFYPAGGGRVQVDVTPSPLLAGFDLMESGRIRERRVRALVANLPTGIGDREVQRVVRRMAWPPESASVEEVASNGPGNVLFAEMHCEHITTICTGFGKVGVTAEQVANGVVRGIRSWMKHRAPVGPFLADQLMLPLALSAAQPHDCGVPRGGRFVTGPLTEHARTHMNLLPRFLDVDISEQTAGTQTTVSVQPRS